MDTITLVAPFSKSGFAKKGLTMTVTLKKKGQQVISLVGEDSAGRKYRGCWRFEEIEKSDDTRKICCCCQDPDGTMVCRPGSCKNQNHD